MGQYHKVVNLDRKEYIDPHRLGCGLKLWEQIANSPGVGAALIVLLASHSNGQGGGDLTESPTATPVIGRWRGDRIAFVGDYDDDVRYRVGRSDKKKISGRNIYSKCHAEESGAWRDVSDEVCAVLESALDGKFIGDGWRSFKPRVPAEQDSK